jgi:hypothetical protein
MRIDQHADNLELLATNRFEDDYPWPKKFEEVCKQVHSDVTLANLLSFPSWTYTRTNLIALLRICNLVYEIPDYSIISAESSSPCTDFWLKQWRCVPKLALDHFFKPETSECHAFTPQKKIISEAICDIVEHEISRYRDSKDELEQSMGFQGRGGATGLYFSMLLESSSFRVLRLWSRAVYLPQ